MLLGFVQVSVVVIAVVVVFAETVVVLVFVR